MDITIVPKKHMTQQSELGKLLRAKRLLDKLTVGEAAERIGFGKSGLSDLENGKRNPDWETLLKISDKLGIALDDLIRAVAKDRNVTIAPRTDQELINALNARAAAFPDLQKLLRSLEKADPANYRSFLKMFEVFDQDDDPPS